MKWLTPEEAITAANLTATTTKLDALAKPLGTRIAKSTNGKKTAEERFQALGLLFDRERYEAGHSDFLRLLNLATDELEEHTDTEDDPDEEGLEATSNDEDSSNPPSSTQQPEPYIFEQCKIQVVITLLPYTGQPGGRPVLLAASNHGDFPIVAMLTQEELGSFPPAIAQLLADLKADFPNRQSRASTHNPNQNSACLSQSYHFQAKQQRSNSNLIVLTVMTTSTTNKRLVIYEGQQHWLPDAIALDDQLLRDAFTSLCAELTNADNDQK